MRPQLSRFKSSFEDAILPGRKRLGWTSSGTACYQLIRDVNKQKCLEWALSHRTDDFHDVICSDETTVQLESHCHFCCRKKGQKPRYKPQPKHPIEWNKQCLVPFSQQVYHNGHRFMQDNDPKHTSHCAKKFFADININWWRTPPESPDANLVENLWYELRVHKI